MARRAQNEHGSMSAVVAFAAGCPVQNVVRPEHHPGVRVASVVASLKRIEGTTYLTGACKPFSVSNECNPANTGTSWKRLTLIDTDSDGY
jgi:hypothetical protein